MLICVFFILCPPMIDFFFDTQKPDYALIYLN